MPEALVGLQLRLAWRPAAAWAAAFAAIVLSSALAYAPAFPDAVARARLAAALGGDPGLRGLFGSAARIDTMAGFVEWRCGVLLATIAAAWAGLAIARLLRGAEDEGHAELLVAQPVARRTLTATALAAVLALALALATAVAAAGVAGGLAAGRAALFGLSLAAPAAVFAGVGALVAQAAPTRGRAAAWSGAAVALAFALRVAADSDHDLRALGALSPLGWSERVHPLTDPRAGWLVLSLGVATATAVAALAIAARRDVGASMWRRARRPGRAPRTPDGLGAWGAVGGWAVGVGAFCFMTGMISASVGALAKSSGQALSRNQLTADVLSPRGYVATVLLMVSALVATYAARAALRAHEEESAGRLSLVLAAPTRRGGWLARRLARAAAGATGLMLLAGVSAWAGARSRGIGLGLGEMAGAGAAGLAPVAVVLGAAVLTYGGAPRLTGAVATGGAGLLLMLQLVGESLNAPAWVTWLSPFAHAGSAPLDPARPAPLVALAAVAVALTTAGMLAFTRRDVGGA